MFGWMKCILWGHIWGDPVSVVVERNFEVLIIACQRFGAARCLEENEAEDEEPDFAA